MCTKNINVERLRFRRMENIQILKRGVARWHHRERERIPRYNFAHRQKKKGGLDVVGWTVSTNKGGFKERFKKVCLLLTMDVAARGLLYKANKPCINIEIYRCKLRMSEIELDVPGVPVHRDAWLPCTYTYHQLIDERREHT